MSCCVGQAVHAPYRDLHMSLIPSFFFFLSSYAHNIITTGITSTILAHNNMVYVQPRSAP